MPSLAQLQLTLAATCCVLLSAAALKCYECHECTSNTTKKNIVKCQAPNDNSCEKKSKTIGKELINLELGCSSQYVGSNGFSENTNCNGYQWGTTQNTLECFTLVHCTDDLCNSAPALASSHILTSSHLVVAATVMFYLYQVVFPEPIVA